MSTAYNVQRSSQLKKTITNVGNSSVTIAASEPNRLGMIIFNNSSNSAYISFDTQCVAANCVRLVASYSHAEIFAPICWTGVVTAIRNSGSGQITVWEFL